MFIRNGLRFNIYAAQTLGDVFYPNFLDPALRASLGITETAEPEPPADYTPETYYRQEIADAPYVVYTKKPADQLAAQRWEQLKQIRDDMWENGGCKVEVDPGVFKWFHSDVKSKQQQLALVVMGASISPTLQWKTMDGTFVAMTQTLAQAVFAAQVAREEQVFTIAETKRYDDTPVNEGWPERYTPPEPTAEPAPEV
jgi:hypothetical protein